ncbi:hypothetical protein LPJ81_002478 [Coemansia sp. IMI 209127]|nr:hypothetical protein LPJ81_002478 [Coemansia sp. IMI 209127]
MYTSSDTSLSNPRQAATPASAASISSSSGGGKNSKASVEFVRYLRKTFEAAYGHPSLLSATVRRCENPGLVSVEYTATQRDFARDSKRKVFNSSVLSIQNGELSKVVIGTPTDATDIQASLRSPTDPSLVAVLRSLTDSKRVVDIWRNDTLVKCIDVTDKHGAFYGDSTFGSLAWSNDNTRIVYSAERPEYTKAKPDNAGFVSSDDACDGDITDDIIGSVGGVADPRFYEEESDWGETFNGKRPPALVVVDIDSADTKVLGSPDGITLGQVQFLPDNGRNDTPRIVFTGYKHTVRKHGIVYCQNRPSGIYVTDLGCESFECIHSGAVRSPRVTPSGRGIVFLSTMLGGPHASTSELVYYDLERRSSRVVIPIVRRPLDGQQKIDGTLLPDGFVGVYADQLPLNPWLRIENMPMREFLVFTSTWRSTSVVLTLDLEEQRLELQSPTDNKSSSSVLGANAFGLARLGFGVLLVNFTGSLGFGQDAVLAQIGNIDTATIDEIQRAASQIHSNKEGDANATVYLGGSYSGYTGALLAGLVPGYYRGIVLRNPVINFGENAAMCDIPDWCWAELGLDYDFESPPELAPDAFAQMWQASPSRLSSKVRDPLLLLLGAQDRRVPPAQSLSYYYRLKSANAPVQCKVYPGVGHPLDSVEAERDSFVSIGRFYAKHIFKLDGS